MTSLTKNYHRGQYNFAKRKLEEHFAMFGLNQAQCKALREIVDRMIEEQRKEFIAPESPQLEGESK